MWSEPAGRRVTSPELGCAKAEDMPGASGTKPAMLGPGSGSHSTGQRWEVRVSCLGESSILLEMPPKKRQEVPPPQAASCPARASPP